MLALWQQLNIWLCVLDRKIKRLLNVSCMFALVANDQRNHNPTCTCTCRTARAMLVFGWAIWKIKVHNTCNTIYMDSTRGDISCNKCPSLSFVEIGQCAITLLLATATMNCCYRNSVVRQLCCETIGAELGTTEHNRTTSTTDDLSGEISPVVSICIPEEVCYAA